MIKNCPRSIATARFIGNPGFAFAILLIVVSHMAFAQESSKKNAAPPADLQKDNDLAGIWEGALDVGAFKLRLVFHIERDGDAFRATMDSPDQGAKGMPVSRVLHEETKVTVAVDDIGGQFVGQLNPEFNGIEGTWSQGGRELPLKLKRVDAPTVRLRPQTPKPPFPYSTEEVVFDHQSANFKIAGTLTFPKGTGPFPAAILISGSGAQDRDETIFDHRPFLVLADHLSRAGMAVLRVDDRGVGGTGTDGNPADDTTADFATDVKSAVAWLKARPEIDPERIGLIGHSEGGLIAPLVAVDDSTIAFAILLAGPGVPGDEILYLQSEKIAMASGATADAVATNRNIQEEIFRIMKTESDVEQGLEMANEFLKAEYDKFDEQEKKQVGTKDVFALQHSQVVSVPWFRYFVSFDPRPVLKKVKCPVLALTGEKDLQVVPEQNLPEIETALKSGGNADVTIRTLASLNHLFQTAKTGLVTEYGEIEETFAKEALDAITDWLKPRGFLR